MLLTYLAHFIGAMFLVNAIPHTVFGVCGRPFQSPFASPPGVGLSSPVVNVLWGGINMVIGCGLLLLVGEFNPGQLADLAITLAGGWLAAFGLARYFGRFYFSATPADKQ
ncbi:hypothetical protein [Halioxenophilus sp. WMMB6]|uniref:hypothetical protein n=1 Tax=Halioxenophilus sp. WMMB6 TaxID=3073815 RepID=UPI00295F4663|nr:hypothetical protein [Halioxenophilus sp. WMMB6]